MTFTRTSPRRVYIGYRLAGRQARNTDKGGDRRTPSAGTVPPYYTSRGQPPISLIASKKFFQAAGPLPGGGLIPVNGPFIECRVRLPQPPDVPRLVVCLPLIADELLGYSNLRPTFVTKVLAPGVRTRRPQQTKLLRLAA